MTYTILVTKLYIPSTRPELVPRPRLIEQLNGALHRKLTLISAPAGFGKTTLVTEWLTALQGDTQQADSFKNKVAWLSLDEGDNDPTRFLTYFIAALNHMDGQNSLGAGLLTMLQSPTPPSPESVLLPLINEIAGLTAKAISERILFVLDDYHLVDAQPIQKAISILIENMPPQMHLVITTREDPLLPLSRLRVRGQLTELRAADLRFTLAEAAEFLNQVMGLDLSAEDIAALEKRTEGWIAGLQLAAISLQGKEDTTRLIKLFSGSHRLVLDYLIEEVFKQQPKEIQAFLLQTAVLNRLTGSLCDALTGQENGQATLEALEKANMFIVSLDNERGWYRYHHLFADLLRQRLHQQYQEKIPKLHLRASEWCEQKGLWSDAVRHAFAAEDLERAASLVELAWRPMNMSYQSITWLGWAKALPDELVRSMPNLSTAYGWALLDTGELEAAELRFRDAERWLDTMVKVNEQLEDPPDQKIVLSEEEFRSLSTSIASGRAYLSQALGDVTSAVEYVQQANDLLREDDYFERGLSDILSGFAYWAKGDLEAAHMAVANAISNMQMAGKLAFVISFTSYLADIMTAQGRLHETERTYLRLLGISTERGKPERQETAVLHLGLSELYLEQGDMGAAKQHLQRSEELGEQPAFPPWYRHRIYAKARIMQAQGNLDSVIRLLNGAECLYYRHPIPDVRPLTALITRVWIEQGKLTEALRWVRERDLSVDDDLRYLREFEHITLARLLIAQYKSDLEDGYIHDAMGLLERLLKSAEEGRRMGSVIEILVLQALAYEAQSNIHSALLFLKRALTLAEPEGYVRIFVGEGPPMARLLYEMLSHEISQDYVQRLLAIFPDIEPERIAVSQTQSPKSEWVEPLSERELDVLQLISQGLTNQETAIQLYLSLNTVKVHTRNIYSKLGVNNRTQAVARARTLGIIAK
jgi:LuxR family maltose regulon positive regulatory protein